MSKCCNPIGAQSIFINDKGECCHIGGLNMIEIHADGIKEVECPFCDEPCEESHCPYTEEE